MQATCRLRWRARRYRSSNPCMWMAHRCLRQNASPAACGRNASGGDRVHRHFAGLPERLRYEYRLLGLDDNWMDAKGDTKAVFANLPSGTFRFEVRSHLGTGEASTAAGSLEIVQEPQLLERWWFRVPL